MKTIEQNSSKTLETNSSLLKWFPIWLKALIIPSAKNFKVLIQVPGSNALIGFMFVSVSGVIYYYLGGISPDSPLYDLFEILFLSVLGIALLSFVVHNSSKLFGGKGSLNKLIFCFSLIWFLFTVLVCMLGQIISWILPILGPVIFAYFFYMATAAIGAVENIDSNKSMFTCGAVIFLTFILVVISFIIFEVTQRGLPPP